MKQYTVDELDVMVSDFKKEVYDVIPSSDISHFDLRSLALGWALGKGMIPLNARYLATSTCVAQRHNWEIS